MIFFQPEVSKKEENKPLLELLHAFLELNFKNGPILISDMSIEGHFISSGPPYDQQNHRFG